MFINTFFVIFFLSDFFQESGTTASVPGCPGMVHVRALFPTKSRDQMWKILLFPHKFSLLFFIPFFPFVFLLLLHWRPVFLLDTTTQLQEAQGSCNCSQDYICIAHTHGYILIRLLRIHMNSRILAKTEYLPST